MEYRRFCIAVFTVIAVGIWSLNADMARAETKILKFSSPHPVGTPSTNALNKWVQLVKERTQGRVEIQHFPANQLGKYNEMMEQCRMGSIQGAVNNVGGLGQYVPAFNILATPYLFSDINHYRRVVYGPIGQELSDKLIKVAGLRPLNMLWYWGMRHFTTNKPVYRPEHLKGLKIRAVNSPIYIQALKALGATATPLDITEVYTALQTGVIDGQENPADNIRSYNFQEVQKYLCLDGHIMDVFTNFVNERFWQTLTPKDREIITKSMREVEESQNLELMEKENKSLVWLQEVGRMTVTVPDRAAFREGVSKAFPGEFLKDWGNYWDRIQALK